MRDAAGIFSRECVGGGTPGGALLFLVWWTFINVQEGDLGDPAYANIGAAPEALGGLNPDTMPPDQLYGYAKNLAGNNKYSDAYMAFSRIMKDPQYQQNKDYMQLWRLLQVKVGLST